MSKDNIAKHFSYKDLCVFLEVKHILPSEKRDIFSSHIDGCKVCWSTWNRVRWDAAWVKKGTQELKEYLGSKFEKYFDSSWALAQDWKEMDPKNESEIDKFYTTTPHYLYNSTIFYESGDRYSLKSKFDEIIKKFKIKTAIDYGCGVGNDALMMLENDVEVFFADFPSPSIDFLRWRLDKRRYGNYFSNHYINVKEPGKIPKVDMVWVVDVLEHMSDPLSIFNYISNKTKVFFTYIDSADDNSGRHPFHFHINEIDFSKELDKLGFNSYHRDGHLCVWTKH